MGIKVLLNTTSSGRVSINSPQRQTVRTVAVASAENKTLASLKDVDATDADTNETLVYDEASNKFIVKTLPVVDGGTF